MIDNEYFRHTRSAEEIAAELAKDSTKVDPNLVIPGVNAPKLTDGEDVILAYCLEQRITREEFDEIPAYQRKNK